MPDYKQPQYPMYIISKNRAYYGTTYKAFDKLKIKYYVVVEKNEYASYKHKIEKKGFGKVLILDEKFKEDYDVFSDLGQKGDEKITGPGAARNFCWEHSIKNGFKWHWVFDDNVDSFYRLNKNRRITVSDGTIFRVMEIFSDRYENVAIAGPNYLSYAPDRKALAPYILNWRVYSMLLIRNDIPYRWRGRYNEDTDLSIRALNDGWVTIQFNAFLGNKATTQTMKGGNTSEFYHKEGKIDKASFYAKGGTYNKSKMLVDMHPNICKMIMAYGRWHHKCDYSGFKTKLKLKPGIVINKGINNYGMKLIRK